MKVLNVALKHSWQALLLLLLVHQPVLAADYSEYIGEEYLRAEFTFEAGDKLKYSECKKKSYPTCIYIWGAAHKKDETRLNSGLVPEGNKLQIVYAQARSNKDFQRVLTTYSDAEKVDGLGVEAVWSSKRSQLSLIAKQNLIVHVYIRASGVSNLKSKSTSIAKYLLEKL